MIALLAIPIMWKLNKKETPAQATRVKINLLTAGVVDEKTQLLNGLNSSNNNISSSNYKSFESPA